MFPLVRRLTIDLTELEIAFETDFPEMHSYLDTETGEVVAVTDDCCGELERLREGAGPEAPLEELLRDSTLPDWRKRALAEAQRVEEHYGTSVVAVPKADVGEDIRDMEAFVATVPEPRLRDELQRALRGRGPFRRFRETMGSALDERDRWVQFKRHCFRQRMTDWLASLDLEPVWKEPPPPPPRPPVRPQLLAAALLFVRAASRLPGVKRIALIGSLTTSERWPKDIDLLVTITDDMDLAPLAKAARQLNGRAMQTGESRGGDVFLADVSGKYLGRTCPWKECGPGIRQSCDALHCGQRHYLHDDLHAITLPSALIEAPPIELWPVVVARVEVPPDVEEVLLAPIRAGIQIQAGQCPPTETEDPEHE
jgi:hypothetical protein